MRSAKLLSSAASFGLVTLGLVAVGACSSSKSDNAGRWELGVRVGQAEPSSTSAGRNLGGVGVDASGNATLAYRRIEGSRGHVVVHRFAGAWSDATAIDGEGEAAPITTVSGIKRPLLAVGASGSVQAVWTARKADSFSLLAARYDQGSWTQTPIAEKLSAPLVDAVVAADDGKAFALWRDVDADGFRKPRVSRSNGPAEWSAPELVARQANSAPAIAVNGKGDAIAVWVETAQGGKFTVLSKRFHAGAGWDAEPSAVTGETNQPITSPRVAIDASAGAIASWSQGGSLWVNHLDASGAWASATSIDRSAFTADDAPAVCINEAGDGFIVWTFNQYVRYLPFTTKSGFGSLDVAPNVLPASSAVADDAGVDAGTVPFARVIEARCALDPAGRLTIAFIGWPQPDPSQSPPATNGEVWTHSYAGGAWKNAIRLSPPSNGTNDNPEIAVNAAGAVFVAWEHFAADGISIWAARRAKP